MKTPVQEFYEYMEGNQYFIGNDLYKKYQELIEREKKMIMEAHQDGAFHTEWDEATDVLENAQDYYNETFNTKEK